MFTRLAAVAGALLFAGAPAMATSTRPTLQLHGQINRSCALPANQVGTVTLDGNSGRDSRLDSTAQGGRPAILGYATTGGPASVGFVSGSVLRNGTERLINGQHQLLEIQYETMNRWVTVFQNTSNNTYNNQTRVSVEGAGQMDVEARTNAHVTQAGVIETGSYVVKTVMECIPAN